MKNFFFLLFTFPLILFAQSNNYIVNENNIWSTVEIFCVPEGTYYNSHFLKIEGDTLIETLNYQKVWRSDEAEMISWEVIGLMRENEFGQVYLRPLEYIEGLIYDFQCNVGDSILVENTFFSSSRYFHVIDIDEIELTTGIKKRISLYNPEYDQTEIWIEDVGSYLGFLNSGGYDTNTCGGSAALCFTENDTLIYQNPDFVSCYIDSLISQIDEYPSNVFSLYPNPTSNILNIQINSPDIIKHDYQLYNSEGKEIKSDKILYRKTSIDLSDLSAGIYLFRVENHSRIFFIQ